MGFATARIVSSGLWPSIMRMYPRLELDIGWRDLIAALSCPQRSLVAVQKLRAWAPVGSAMITALSVRSAFDALLTALDLPPGSKIAMSAISVEAMAEIARAHDLALHPVDIEFSAMLPRGEAVEAALREGARIFVLAHLFGTRAKI